MYARKVEVCNCNKENTDVVGLKWDICNFLASCQCVTWKRKKVCLKQHQEKSKIAFKNSEMYARIKGFKSEGFWVSDWYFAMLMGVFRNQDHWPMNYQWIFATHMEK